MSLLTGVILAQESYMQDVDIDINVGSSSEDIAEAEAEAAVAEDETNEAEEEVDNAEMILSKLTNSLDTLIPLKHHVEEYGVDRTFLRLYNKNGELSQLIGIRLPATESFTSTPNRYSETSMACLEGFGSAIKTTVQKVRAFLINLFKMMTNFLQNLFNSTASAIVVYDKKHKDLVKNYSDDEDKIAKNGDKEVKLPKDDYFNKMIGLFDERIKQLDNLPDNMSNKATFHSDSSKQFQLNDDELETKKVGDLDTSYLLARLSRCITTLQRIHDKKNNIMGSVKDAQKKSDKEVTEAESSEDNAQVNEAAKKSKAYLYGLKVLCSGFVKAIKSAADMYIRAVSMRVSKKSKSNNDSQQTK